MKNSKIVLTLMVAALLSFVGLNTAPADAQMILVESKYRVVDVDKFENRIRVALPEDDNGPFSDQVLGPEAILNAAAAREGQLIRVHGGRDWDGSINAKSVWM